MFYFEICVDYLGYQEFEEIINFREKVFRGNGNQGVEENFSGIIINIFKKIRDDNVFVREDQYVVRKGVVDKKSL